MVKKKIVFISTYPPKKCGIASFTQDLVKAIDNEISKDIIIAICALDKDKNAGLYEQKVSMTMDGANIDSCIKTAKEINSDTDIKLICIEHEFGLFGGDMGEYVLTFLSLLEKPFIIRFHTVLPNPTDKMLSIVRSIALLADKIIVMTNNSARIIKEDYYISADKIVVIPHGTHVSSTIDATELKAKYNLSNKQVLTTFGLLSPNKGIEKGILAMKQIRMAFPDAMYVVLGQTHPNLIQQEGEKYRNYLQQLISENNLHQHVKLINEYVPTEKLMEYLALTDIYLFTSKDPQQAVSGTFLYAMSAGCPIISNAFVLATEMLDEKTGVILTTTSESELAENAIRILKNPKLEMEMRENALLKTKNTTWQKVGQAHINIFSKILPTNIYLPKMPAIHLN
ncbi:MAG: glycosyltransferase [Parafilimonas sp.]